MKLKDNKHEGSSDQNKCKIMNINRFVFGGREDRGEKTDGKNGSEEKYI